MGGVDFVVVFCRVAWEY